MIEITGLTQAYQGKTVLDQVDLTVGKREICALVGHNGAGKTTLIHSILRLMPVKQGTVLLNGITHHQEGWKKHVAYLPEKFQLYPQLTGEENIQFFASLAGRSTDAVKMEQCLRQVGLWEAREQRVSRYSKGMQQRLGLGIMLYYDADIIILDEPTSGLDPQGRADMLGIMRTLYEKTVLFSSHYMEEIKQVCTHVAHLADRKIAKYTTEQFFDRIGTGGTGL